MFYVFVCFSSVKVCVIVLYCSPFYPLERNDSDPAEDVDGDYYILPQSKKSQTLSVPAKTKGCKLSKILL